MNRLLLSTAALCALITPFDVFGQTPVGSISVGPPAAILGPTEMVINQATNKAYVFGVNSADVIDLSANRVIGTVTLPPLPPTASLTSAGFLFVNSTNNRIFVFRGNQFVAIDGSTDTVVQTFLLPANNTPSTSFNYGPVAYNPTSNRFYVGEIDTSAVIEGDVRILDGNTFTTLAQVVRPDINAPSEPSENPIQILVNPGNNRVYILYSVSGMQILDGSSNAILAQATCATTCNGLAFSAPPNGERINPADNSVWVASSGFLPATFGGEDGPGIGAGLPFTKLYRVDATSNAVTSPILIPGLETEFLGFDPTTGLMYMMADDLPTVLNPTLASPVISVFETMLTVLDPNNAAPTAADPSPMRRITVDGQLLARNGTPYSCGFTGNQAFEPIALDLAGGYIYWRCDSTPNAFSSIVVSKMTFTDLGNVDYSQFIGQIPTTATGQLSSHALPWAVSSDFDLGSNIGPNHQALFFSTFDNQLMNVNPAVPSETTVQLGSQPAGIAIDPLNKRAYVTDLTSKVLSVIDTAAFAVASRVPAPGGSLIAANAAHQYVLAGASSPAADPNQTNGAFLFDGSSNSVTTSLQAAATSAISVNPVTNIGYFADTNQWFAVDLTSGVRLYAVSDLTAAGNDTCQMTGISVSKANSHIFVAGKCTAGGNTLAVFDGTTRSLTASVNVDAIMIKTGRLIVNPNTNAVYIEATVNTPNSGSPTGPSVEVFNGGTLAHTNSIPNRSGPFAVNTVTSMVYAAGSVAGVAAIDGLAPEQTSVFGPAVVASAIAVDEVSNLVYMTSYSNLLGFALTGPVYGIAPGTMSAFHQDPPTYLVQGLILSGGLPQTGITVTITGAGTLLSQVTSANGIFATRLAVGTYSLALSNPAFAYSPATMTFTVGQIDMTLPTFTATPVFHVTGAVLTQAATPVAGVTINATGASGSATAVTGTNGQYSLAGLPAGTYTITPVSPVNFYSPTSESVQVNKTDVVAPPFTVNPSLQIVSFTVSSAQIGAGSTATGTVTINEVAPKGGIAITLASSDTKTVKPPTTFNIPAGATSGSFTFTGSGTATVTLTASYTGSLAAAPTSATTQVSVVAQDTIKVTSATWSSSTQQLNVTATSTNPQAILAVTLASNGQNLGTMTRQENGTLTLAISVATRPASINVKSNLGGSTGQGVTLLP